MTSVEVVTKCDRCANIDALPRREVATLTSEELTGLRFVEAKRKRRPNSKTRAYQSALGSARWKALRDEVLSRDNFECQIRADGCTGEATEVDHKSYENFTNERMEELRASCRSCNQSARASRIAFGR